MANCEVLTVVEKFNELLEISTRVFQESGKGEKAFREHLQGLILEEDEKVDERYNGKDMSWSAAVSEWTDDNNQSYYDCLDNLIVDYAGYTISLETVKIE